MVGVGGVLRPRRRSEKINDIHSLSRNPNIPKNDEVSFTHMAADGMCKNMLIIFAKHKVLDYVECFISESFVGWHLMLIATRR